MPRFIPLNYQQNTMVVINYLDQLQSDTFEHAIHHLLVEKLDALYPISIASKHLQTAD